MHVNMFISGLLLVLFSGSVTATCSRFVQVGQTYTNIARNQAQQISNGTSCIAGMNGTYTNDGYSTCATDYNSTTKNSTLGCAISGLGSVHATGFNNLSLSPAEAAPIYSLIFNTSSFGASLHEQGRLLPVIGYYGNSSSCVSSNIFQTCALPGQSGYLQYTPLLQCVNGSLEDCSGGPVANGTAISICGAAVENTTTIVGDVSSLVIGSADFIDTTAAQANTTFADNPAANATCDVSPSSTSAATLAVKRSGVAYIAFTIAFGVAALLSL